MKQKNKKFDFIMIDTNHESKNIVSDIYLSWSILKKSGIIYLYNKNHSLNINIKDIQNMFENKVIIEKKYSAILLKKIYKFNSHSSNL